MTTSILGVVVLFHMPYISDLKAPDITDLGATLFSRTTVGLVFQGLALPESPSAARLLTAYFSVVDKAVREYSDGRITLIAYANSSNDSQLMGEGLGRFETCIQSAKRAFRLLEKLKSHPESPAIDRTLRRLIQSQEQILITIRNTIEHIDDEIMSETTLIPGMAHILTINHDGDYLEITSHRLTFVHLAVALRNLHKLGCELLETLSASVTNEVSSN